ncbi:MAG: 5'-Nucleotidase domain protein [Ignavibacteria bacterium]|nr:5'-Nucleotidase domain protein [Ignavibacteria bacterium]
MKKWMFAAILMFLSLNIFSLKAMETVWSKQAYTGSLLLFKTSPDEKYIYTIGADKTYNKWDAKTGEMIEQKTLKFDFSTIDINSDGCIIYYGNFTSTNCHFYSYNIKLDSSELFVKYQDSLFYHTSDYNYHYSPTKFSGVKIKLSPDDKMIVLWLSFNFGKGYYKYNEEHFEGNVDVYNTLNKSLIKNIGSFWNKGFVNFSNDSKFSAFSIQTSWYDLAYYDRKGSSKAFYIFDSTFISINYDGEFYDYFSFSNNNRYLSECISNNGNYYLRVLDIEKKKNIYDNKFNQQVLSSVFSYDNKYVIYSLSPSQINKNNIIEIRHIYSQKLVDSLLYNEINYYLVPSKESECFYTYSTVGKITKWTSNSLWYKLIPDFVSNINECSKYTKIKFTDKTIGDLKTYYWDFGDGTSDTSKNPTHFYNKKGIYDVKLVVYDGKTKDSVIKKNLIKINDFIKDNNYSIDTLWSTKIGDKMVLNVDFSDSGDKVYVASADGKIKAFEISEQNLILNKSLKEPVSIFAFSKNKDKIGYGKSNGSICLQNIFSDTCYNSTIANMNYSQSPGFKNITGITNKVLLFTISEDSILFYTFFTYYFEINENIKGDASYNTISVFNSLSNKLNYLYSIPFIQGTYGELGTAFNIKEKNLAIVLSDPNYKYLITYKNYTEIFHKISINNSFIPASMAFNPKGSDLYVSLRNNLLIRINMSSLTTLDTIYSGNNYFANMVFSPNGRQIFTYHSDSTIDIFDLEKRKFVDHAKLPSAITALAVSADEKHFATGCADGSVWVWKSDNLSDTKDNPSPIQLTSYVYPNPFVSSTNIRYFLSNSAMVKLIIYDALGNEAAIIINTVQETGEHIAEFDAAGLAPGFYFYKLQEGDRVHSGKLVLVR